jgi:transcriptional regulator with XRE-family HTH domain
LCIIAGRGWQTLNQGEKYSEEFGRRLKEQLKKHDMNQKELGKRLGYVKSTITGYVKGRVPKGETLDKLADMFGVSVDYLLGRESPNGIIEGLTPEDNALLTENPELLKEVLRAVRAGTPAMKVVKALKVSVAMADILDKLD